MSRINDDEFFCQLYPAILESIDNEDREKASILLIRFALRMRKARKAHQSFAHGKEHTLEVIREEFQELARAIQMESRERQLDEALDVMATCARFILGEHEQ